MCSSTNGWTSFSLFRSKKRFSKSKIYVHYFSKMCPWLTLRLVQKWVSRTCFPSLLLTLVHLFCMIFRGTLFCNSFWKFTIPNESDHISRSAIWRFTLYSYKRVSSHFVKSVQIRSFFWFMFSCIQSGYRKIWTRKVSVFWLFSHSVWRYLL